jgi:histidine triad (HIT) family protein
MDNCIFCKIVKGDIPASKVYEDSDFVAFLDIHPVSKGHTLVVPKNHFESIEKTPDEVIMKTFVLAKKLIIKLKESLGSDFVNLDIEGIQVPHLHVHLIPRMLNDGVVKWEHTSYASDAERNEFINKIKM